MSEARIGRVVVASLHQAITEILPDRLEFYESWLSPVRLRSGTIGLAPLAAVLSFLRREGEVYRQVTRQAGDYAASWSIGARPAFERVLEPIMPPGVRSRAALRLARKVIDRTYAGSRAITRVRRQVASVEIRGSIFCEVREPMGWPLCDFYAAVVSQCFTVVGLTAEARILRCRASGGHGCQLEAVVGPRFLGESQRSGTS